MKKLQKKQNIGIPRFQMITDYYKKPKQKRTKSAMNSTWQEQNPNNQQLVHYSKSCHSVLKTSKQQQQNKMTDFPRRKGIIYFFLKENKTIQLHKTRPQNVNKFPQRVSTYEMPDANLRLVLQAFWLYSQTCCKSQAIQLVSKILLSNLINTLW